MEKENVLNKTYKSKLKKTLKQTLIDRNQTSKQWQKHTIKLMEQLKRSKI
jgi:hypothetical protein